MSDEARSVWAMRGRAFSFVATYAVWGVAAMEVRRRAAFVFCEVEEEGVVWVMVAVADAHWMHVRTGWVGSGGVGVERKDSVRRMEDGVRVEA